MRASSLLSDTFWLACAGALWNALGGIGGASKLIGLLLGHTRMDFVALAVECSMLKQIASLYCYRALMPYIALSWIGTSTV